MNIRFEPTQILDVSDLQYCEFCSQAVFSRSVHDDQQCILNDLCLKDSSKSGTKTLNFSFYQCFLKNCTLQVTYPEDFITHLKKHGIMLESAVTKSKHKYRCQKCPYKTTQQRYLDSHKRLCTGKYKVPNTSHIGDVVAGSSDNSAYKDLVDESSCVPEGSTHSPLQKTPPQNDKQNEDNITRSVAIKKSHRHSCHSCSFSTTQRRYLEKHLKVCPELNSDEVQNEEVQIPCTMCSYVAQNPWALEVHMQSHTISQLAPNLGNEGGSNIETGQTVSPTRDVGETELHNCTDCSFKTRNLLLFNLHAKSCIRNKNKRDSLLKQKIAQVVLKRVISAKVKYEKLEEFKCEFCSYASTSKLKVRTHRASHFRKQKDGKKRKGGILSSSLWGKSRTKDFKSSVGLKSPAFNASSKLHCSFCPFEAKLSIMIKHHEKKCNSVLYRNFRCKSCSDVFTSQLKLNRHLPSCKIASTNTQTTKHSSKKQHCENCAFVTGSELVLAKHSSLCGIPDYEKFRCQRCFHIYANTDCLARHLRVTCCAKGVGQSFTSKFSCNKCSYRASNQASAVVHKALCGNENFKRCAKCFFVAKSQYLYSKHVHGSCRKSSQNRALKNKRRNSGHFKFKKCPNCFKMIKSEYHRLHKQRCSNPRYDAFKCPHRNCNFVGVEEKGLKVHIGKSHIIPEEPLSDEPNQVSVIKTIDGKFRCSLCTYSSATRPRTETHVTLCELKQNGNKDILKCDKPDCPILCRSMTGLVVHKRRAHKRKPSSVALANAKIGVKETTVEKNSDKVKKQSLRNRSPKLYKCDKCPYSTAASKKQLMIHKALCFLKQNGTSEIILCEHPNCHYLTESVGSYKKHYKLKHSELTQQKAPIKTNRVSLAKVPSKATNTPRSKKTCNDCPFSCSLFATMKVHRLLCSRKLLGDTKVIVCDFPGCHHLATSLNSLKIHVSRIHFKRSLSLQEKIVEPNISKSANSDTNPVEERSKPASNDSVKLLELKPCPTPKAMPVIISFKHEPQTVDYYRCSRCSFRCLQSDAALIDSHKENCRTQLFQKFQLPAKDNQKLDATALANDISYSPGTQLSEQEVSPPQLYFALKPNKSVETLETGHLEGMSNKDSLPYSKLDTVAKSETLVLGSLEAKTPSNFLDEAITDVLTGQSSHEEMLESDASQPHEKLCKENDIFDSEEEEELSLCLDSEYFI